MAMDLHVPNTKGPITLKIKDRSDTARRHQLARQTKIEDAEDLEEAKRTAALNRSFSPKLPGIISTIINLCGFLWSKMQILQVSNKINF